MYCVITKNNNNMFPLNNNNNVNFTQIETKNIVIK